MKNLNLARARKEKGLTQEELAEKLGYSKATVSNWENGYSTPQLTDAFKVASILGKDINHLFLIIKYKIIIQRLI
ncbi:helix-turn-helix transcriptional regulator [Domibacillus sp. A3M-37]|uniref:helix-turn-helix transcriptional regulator n=1 Tax=Domibacillus sp. A3M-37 TaxID=2962037 RepID=UPI0020B711DD|nr:helix-turn-helix domain-containing protein [Domibacillus sp. A3M-37]MCP3764814.1 helix-turn-helix transcriptional regulator [Domibacillus sp. A3M-37]